MQGLSMYYPCSSFSLSNSHRHLANADVIANMKSKIILHQHFLAHIICSATSKLSKLNQRKISITKQICVYYIFQYILKIFSYIYMLYSLSLANYKQMRKCNRLYWSLLFACFFSVDVQGVSQQFPISVVRPKLGILRALEQGGLGALRAVWLFGT